MSHRSLPGTIRQKKKVATYFQVLKAEVRPRPNRRYHCSWKPSPKRQRSACQPQQRSPTAATSPVARFARSCQGTSNSCRKPEFPSPVSSTSCPVCGWGSRQIRWISKFSIGENTCGWPVYTFSFPKLLGMSHHKITDFALCTQPTANPALSDSSHTTQSQRTRVLLLAQADGIR